jgi:acyl carrier protein
MPSVPQPAPDPEIVSRSVRKILIAESRLDLEVDAITDHELLNGPLLKVNSLSLVGLLIRLEDELDTVFADGLLVGRSFTTVSDLEEAVFQGIEVAPEC